MFRFAPPAGLGLALAAVLTSGCGGSGPASPPDYGSADGLKIAQVVSEFNDAKADSAKFRTMFVAKPPASRREYEKVAYDVVIGSPKVDGDSATASVEIHSESDSVVIATKEWTFVKVGEAWKLKDAPLK